MRRSSCTNCHHPVAAWVTVRGRILGLAYSDEELLVFLEGAGLQDPELVLDNETWVEWRGGRAHEWSTA